MPTECRPRLEGNFKRGPAADEWVEDEPARRRPREHTPPDQFRWKGRVVLSALGPLDRNRPDILLIPKFRPVKGVPPTLRAKENVLVLAVWTIPRRRLDEGIDPVPDDVAS